MDWPRAYLTRPGRRHRWTGSGPEHVAGVLFTGAAPGTSSSRATALRVRFLRFAQTSNSPSPALRSVRTGVLIRNPPPPPTNKARARLDRKPEKTGNQGLTARLRRLPSTRNGIPASLLALRANRNTSIAGASLRVALVAPLPAHRPRVARFEPGFSSAIPAPRSIKKPARKRRAFLLMVEGVGLLRHLTAACPSDWRCAPVQVKEALQFAHGARSMADAP